MSRTPQLPWSTGTSPLMLAPMQGLTNRAMRALFIDWVRPDVVFTEFMRVSGVSRKRLTPTDLRDVSATEGGVPLVVQLVGHGCRALVEAAQIVEDAGAQHINLNLGCPYGRMTTAATGGKLLKQPETLDDIISALRDTIKGSFSIKLRAGYDNPEQIFTLLKLFEDAGVDFLILHPRTVVQAYSGRADHLLTAEVVRATHLPVIANGDITTAKQGRQVLSDTAACGLMLGRGAIANPLLFEQLRCQKPPVLPSAAERAAMLQEYLFKLLARYRELFCGDLQVLNKIKRVLHFIDDPAMHSTLAPLKKAKTMESLESRIVKLDRQVS